MTLAVDTAGGRPNSGHVPASLREHGRAESDGSRTYDGQTHDLLRVGLHVGLRSNGVAQARYVNHSGSVELAKVNVGVSGAPREHRFSSQTLLPSGGSCTNITRS